MPTALLLSGDGFDREGLFQASQFGWFDADGATETNHGQLASADQIFKVANRNGETAGGIAFRQQDGLFYRVHMGALRIPSR